MKEQIAEAMGWADVWMTQQTFYWLTSTIAQVFAALVVFSFAIVGMIISKINSKQGETEDQFNSHADILYSKRNLRYHSKPSELLFGDKYAILEYYIEKEQRDNDSDVAEPYRIYRETIEAQVGYIIQEINAISVSRFSDTVRKQCEDIKRSMNKINDWLEGICLETVVHFLEHIDMHNLSGFVRELERANVAKLRNQLDVFDTIRTSLKIIVDTNNTYRQKFINYDEQSSKISYVCLLVKKHKENTTYLKEIRNRLRYPLILSTVAIVTSLAALTLSNIFPSWFGFIIFGISILSLIPFVFLGTKLFDSPKPTDDIF